MQLPSFDTCFRLPAKSILLLFFWSFTIKFVYNLIFKIAVILWLDRNLDVEMEAFSAITFLCFAPVASFVADVKFGRFKTLVSSTCVIIISNSIFIVGMCGFYAVHNFNYLFYIFAIFIFVGSIASLCGMVFFLCNIIQFGTDQLRDVPTRRSVLFLCAIYWCDSISYLLALCISLPGKNIYFYLSQHYIYVDEVKSSLLVDCLWVFCSTVYFGGVYSPQEEALAID